MTRPTPPSPPPPPIPGLTGRVLAALYARVIHRINAAYDNGKNVTRLDRPVISVGNLSVGGTGKTPMVMRLARLLLDAGATPAIAMRGYRSHHGLSDEAREYAAALPGAHVVAQPDRIAGLRALFTDHPEIDVVLLDDGFQHRRLARDLDIVLLDVSADPLRDRLLPAGMLREPISSLARAHAVVITHAQRAPLEDVEELILRIGDVAPRAEIAVTRHAWGDLVTRRVGADAPLDGGWIRGRPVVVACAIGRPAAFLDLARAALARDPAAAVVLPDHDRFSPRTVRRIARAAIAARAEAILVTEKDWTKLAHLPDSAWPCPVVRPRLELRFDLGEPELRDLVLHAARRPVPTYDPA